MTPPLLLSAPSRIICDAARAVKRKAGLMIERVTYCTSFANPSMKWPCARRLDK